MPDCNASAVCARPAAHLGPTALVLSVQGIELTRVWYVAGSGGIPETATDGDTEGPDVGARGRTDLRLHCRPVEP
jgi:hypothetical protein